MGERGGRAGIIGQWNIILGQYDREALVPRVAHPDYSQAIADRDDDADDTDDDGGHARVSGAGARKL
jgi:hypothetical protein